LIGDASNYSSNLDFVEQIPNQTGLLPNDRTHVFKFSGSYRFQFGLTFGTLVSLQSGTPISELGSTPMGAPWFIFLSERGSVRRTPAIFNIDLRLTYKPTRIANSRFNYKIILDMMNLTNKKTAVTFEELHFFRVDENGNQASTNPNFGKPASYRAPLTVRLGFEVGFD